jgi:hypothetical protein
VSGENQLATATKAQIRTKNAWTARKSKSSETITNHIVVVL